jgi:hypothetical protein
MASAKRTIRTSDAYVAACEIASGRQIFCLLIAVDKWISGIVPLQLVSCGGPQPPISSMLSFEIELI